MRQKVKVLVSFIITVALIVGLFPNLNSEVQAGLQSFDNVVATITLPVEGGFPTAFQTGTVSSPSGISITQIDYFSESNSGWKENNDSFYTGEKLRIYVSFSSSNQFDDSTLVKINGEIAIRSGDGRYYISYTIPSTTTYDNITLKF